MYVIRLRLVLLFLGVSIAAASLSSCSHGDVSVLKKAKTGAMGFGTIGGHPDDHFWPKLIPDSPEVVAVNQAVRRGIEKALGGSPAFDYVPFAQMQEVPRNQDPFKRSLDVTKFAKTNGLDAVLSISVIPDMRHVGVSLSFTTMDAQGRVIATASARAHGDVPQGFQLKSLTAPGYLPGWEKAAQEAMQKALVKVRG